MVRVAPPVDGVSQASQMLVLLTSHVWGARIRAPQIAADETTDEIVSAADKNAAADQRIIIQAVHPCKYSAAVCLCTHITSLPCVPGFCARTIGQHTRQFAAACTGGEPSIFILFQQIFDIRIVPRNLLHN